MTTFPQWCLVCAAQAHDNSCGHFAGHTQLLADLRATREADQAARFAAALGRTR